MRGIALLALGLLMALPNLTWAFDFDWPDFDWPDIDLNDMSIGDVSISLNNRVTIGASWRLEERDENLLGKLNVPGQQELCTPDDCLNLGGDPEPIRRLVNAKGGFALTNADDGNMNYDQ